MLHQTPSSPPSSPAAPPPQPASGTAMACPSLGDILAAAVAAEGSTLVETLSSSRQRPASRARQAAMWLAFKVTPHSLQSIGRAFGRHHTTVIYAIRAYDRHLAADARAGAKGDRLLAQFLTRHADTLEAKAKEILQ